MSAHTAERAATGTNAVRIEAWQDYEKECADQPGVRMGTETLSGDLVAAVHDLFARGARHARLDEPVTPGDGAGPALAAVRELTGQGMSVEWELATDRPDAWQELRHLHPPARIVGPGGPDPEALAAWRAGYHYGQFTYRRGPGFLQVRDRRTGTLALTTLQGDAHLEAAERLLNGADPHDLPAAPLAEFEAAGLVLHAGDRLWWAPYRLRRWPFPAMFITATDLI